MKYIKILESEIKKTFSEWLKNPRKPEEKIEPKKYIFKIGINVESTLLDNGDFSTSDLLEYADLWDDVAVITRHEVSELRRNLDLLDEAFEEYIKDIYGKGGWQSFLRDNFETQDPIDEDQIDELRKSLKKLNPKFDKDEAWFRVISTEIIGSDELREYSIKSEFGNVYFELEINRELRDQEEKDWVKDYIEDIICKISEVNKKEKRYIEHHGRYRGESRCLYFNRDYSWDEISQIYPTT